MNTNTIYHFSTTATKEGYIGFARIGFNVGYNIVKESIKCKCRNFLCKITGIKSRKYLKIWAIDDNNHKYDIYIEVYYKNK